MPIERPSELERGEAQTQSGDILTRNGGNQSLALNTGEGLKIGQDGRMVTFNQAGVANKEKPIAEATGGKPHDFGMRVYNNDVAVRDMVDGSQRVEFPSGSSVTVRNGRIQTVRHSSGQEHDLDNLKLR